MKKKLLLIIFMFLFITNVKALTFDVDVTNIEDKGNNGTIGSITNIDVENKTLSILFSDSSDQVLFEVTVSNSGDRAGTLKNINITGTNNKIEYTTNLPAGGMSINGNDTNKVLVTASLKSGAVNGTSSSTIKLTYNYDEGSCPEGETLSDDESMCLCPEEKVRNEQGICITPPKPVECKDDEIYNTESKTCEKKVVPVEPDEPEPTPAPVVPENPKTLDNVILIALLFLVSGLGIYAAIFKKLNTSKKKITAGTLIGVITLAMIFNVLTSVFGIDKLLGAIINPITKTKELTITVNEKIEFAEVWNGECSVDYSQYSDPTKIFEGGSGTEQDPYQIKTADQLACFAKSVNEAQLTYEGKYIKQIKDIKLNDHLISDIDNQVYDNHNEWHSIGDDTRYGGYAVFSGTYDGDNHTISGILLTNTSSSSSATPVGLFGVAKGATFKNLNLSDVFIEISNKKTGALLGRGFNSLTIDNVTASGKYSQYSDIKGGIVGEFIAYDLNNSIPITDNEFVIIENSTNNISPVAGGIINSLSIGSSTVTVQETPNIVLRNVTNNGAVVNDTREVTCGGIANRIVATHYDEYNNVSGQTGYILIENAVNTANINSTRGDEVVGGLTGAITAYKVVIKKSHNTGNIVANSSNNTPEIGGLSGWIASFYGGMTIEESYNSGNITNKWNDSYDSGLTEAEVEDLRSNEFAGDIGGLIGSLSTSTEATNTITDSFNTGDIKGLSYYMGGIIAEVRQSNYQDEAGDNIVISDSYNTGHIYTVYGNTGGIAGLYGGSVINCYNEGKIVLAGHTDTYGRTSVRFPAFSGPVGGLVGIGHIAIMGHETATITNSYNEGEIRATAIYNTVPAYSANPIYNVVAGGICGLCGAISGSHNSGNITSTYATQIFNGIAYYATSISADTYSDGTITTP